jgi:N-methylhydantoinase B
MSITPSRSVDRPTLDLIENALLNVRFEMDEVVRRAAMSPMIRVQHDEFPMICNRRGQMVVGQFGSYIPGVIERMGGDIAEGDVILFNDPYLSDGSITHCNDWCLVVPIHFQGRHVAFASMFGHMMDVGGKVPGSQVNDAGSIWEEGLRIPPIKIVEAGRLNRTALDIILNNTRTPEMNESDLMALVAGCRVAETRVVELCHRFGPDVFEAACDALLDRTRAALTELVRRYIPEEKVTFADWVDDDGLGNGPFRIVLTLWREGDVCHVDWTGTDAQAPGSINFCINEGLCKLFFGIYLIMAFDPKVLFNDGVYDVFEVTLPEGSLLNPRFPAAVSNRLNVHVRFFDCMSGALGQRAPELAMAAGYGASPYFVFSGTDEHGDYFQFVELLFGGLPGRATGDGLDGHSWWPLFRTTPAEYTESYSPLRIERYAAVPDSGGAGLHRGGTGLEKEYVFLTSGEFTINDDRALTSPWGVAGGRAGGRGSKLLIRSNGERHELPSKVDALRVEAGDRFVFRTAGAGGWGDPLERPVEQVDRDIRRLLVSEEAAAELYGVVRRDGTVDAEATLERRRRIREERDDLPAFDFGDPPGRPERFEPARVALTRPG